MANHILIIAGIVHELVFEMRAVGSRRGRDAVFDCAGGGVHLLVAIGAPPTSVEYKPGLVQGLQAERVGAADGARGNGLNAQRQ